MNQRNHVRYPREVLPSILSKVSITWHGTQIQSYVVNYSTCGLNLIIPCFPNVTRVPKVDEDLAVHLPVDQPPFNGRCIHVSREPDGSICLGVHFSNAEEQAYLQALLFHSIKPSNEAHYFLSYEWEELVGKLCDSEDPSLKKMGYQHLAKLKAHQTDLQLA